MLYTIYSYIDRLFVCTVVSGPTLTLPDGFSQECQAFVAECLCKRPEERPNAVDLLGHSFLQRNVSAAALGVWLR